MPRPEEGHLMAKSLSNSSSNFIIGPIKDTSQKALPLRHFLDHHGYKNISVLLHHDSWKLVTLFMVYMTTGSFDEI